jgi:hypothetical protein
MPADSGQNTGYRNELAAKEEPIECSLDAVGPLEESVLVIVTMDVLGHIRSHPEFHVARPHVDPVGVSEADELQ